MLLSSCGTVFDFPFSIFFFFSMIFTTGPNLVFNDEIQSVQAAVHELIDAGVNKIIALGHSGYDKDIEVAKNTVGIDVIVGGYTDTFLYTGEDRKPNHLFYFNQSVIHTIRNIGWTMYERPIILGPIYVFFAKARH